MIVVMIAAFYFLIIRPQRKRQQQQTDMVKKLGEGSRVVTSTGIFATVVAVGEKQIVLETSPGSQITVLKQAVGRVVDDNEEDAELIGYRGAPDTIAGLEGIDQAPDHTGYEYGAAGSDEDGSDSGDYGMAGGAPIQEYTPDSAPDFTAPGQSDSHETAPWPSEGHDVSGAAADDSELNDTGIDSYGRTRDDEGFDRDRENGR